MIWSRELLLCEGVTVESRLGATPVEYSGKADQKEYYFRSRGQRWEMIIGASATRLTSASRLRSMPARLKTPNSIAQGATGESDSTQVICRSNGAEEIIRRCVRLWRAAQHYT